MVLAYNAGPYLFPCLQSVAAQTWPALEAVVVDNGSTDGSGAVCGAFAAKDPRFFGAARHKSGSTGGRAKGLAAAKGDYVFFVDGDDLLHPHFVQTLVEACLSASLPAAACRVLPFPGSRLCLLRGRRSCSLTAPPHLNALLHNKQVEYSLCNKLYHRSLFCRRTLLLPGQIQRGPLSQLAAVENAAGLALTGLDGYFIASIPPASPIGP